MDHHDRPLWMLSASELSTGYGKALTPRNVVDATLTRIEQINPHLNAIITLDADGAIEAAAHSTQRWRDGHPKSPLDGVTFTIKDSIYTAGLRTTWGSKACENYIPDIDDLPVQRLRDAGAVILGKTNVPEFTVQGFTGNALFGVTRNPWNTDLTPGGSSGGAVAAVATGMGALALGTDAGGSIRRPCAHTGLVGLKPSRGMVPRGKGFPAITLDFEVIGPIARSIADIEMTMDVIANPAWRTPHEQSQTKRRIAFAPAFGNAPVDPVIAAAVNDLAERMRRDGHQVELLQTFDLAAPVADVWPVISQTGVAWLLDQHREWRDQVTPAIAEMAAAGNGYSARDYLQALDTIAAMRPAFEKLFTRYDLLMTPTTAAMPWPASEIYPSTIGGHAVGPRGHAVFTPFANALGLPAMSLPCGASDGIPIGVQLCAAWDADARLLDFAKAYETAFRFPDFAPPPVS